MGETQVTSAQPFVLAFDSTHAAMAAQAASPSARMDSRNRSARVSNSFMVTPLKS